MNEPIGELHPWAQQINTLLADTARRVERLDAHSAELAKEALDIIERLDGLATRVQALEALTQREQALSHALEDDVDGRVLAEQRALAARVADLERSDLEQRLDARIEKITTRLERSLDSVERRVDNHEGDHWREGRR